MANPMANFGTNESAFHRNPNRHTNVS
jgi:hypothetical protein